MKGNIKLIASMCLLVIQSRCFFLLTKTWEMAYKQAHTQAKFSVIIAKESARTRTVKPGQN